MRSFLLRVARLPNRPQGRVALSLIFAAGLAPARSSDARSVGVAMAVVGVVTLNGWAMLTDWGGVSGEHVLRERRRVDGLMKLPMSRTRAGRTAIDLNRRDHESTRGRNGVTTFLAGPYFIVMGVLLNAGLLAT